MIMLYFARNLSFRVVFTGYFDDFGVDAHLVLGPAGVVSEVRVGQLGDVERVAVLDLLEGGGVVGEGHRVLEPLHRRHGVGVHLAHQLDLE